MVKKVFIAGHLGMVGSALRRQLSLGDGLEFVLKSRSELDLTNQQAVDAFFEKEAIDEVYLAAAKVGGIQANNNYPAEFIYQNLAIQNNVIHAAYKADVQKLLFLGSSCIYPRLAAQPMNEQALLTGALEPTNEPYAIAKIAGIKLCESYSRQYGVDYRSVMPTNLYGENDNFHPNNSHVIPALMLRIHEAKLNNDSVVSIWGSGKPKREFLHVDDMAQASIFIMNLSKDKYSQLVDARCSHINVGTGVDISINELARTVCRVVGYEGELVFDATKPDGAPRKLLDVSRLSELGWQSSVGLEQGLKKTYDWLLSNNSELRGI